MKTIEWPKWPQYGPEEQAAVDRVIRSNQLFADREVKTFENQYASYIGCKYALGLGNATQGLHLSLAALNIGVGDEVIVTPYSWISSASCVLMQNAVPIFCDIEEESLGLCPKEIENNITDKTKAIIVVHMFGYPAKIKEIVALSEKYNIPLVEDASHAHGANVDGQKIGCFGSISVFSLHQRKSISVGDGGIVCTNDPDIFEKIYKLRSFGHEELSYNYRMTEFAGALGQVGLDKLDEYNTIRRNNAFYLKELLIKTDKINVRIERKNEVAVYYAVLLEINGEIENQKQRLTKLQKMGIPVRETWEPLHIHPHFNPAVKPARGAPWLEDNYNGEMKNKTYSNLFLPVVNQYCPSKILELDIHPPTGEKEIEFAAKSILKVLLQ